MIGENRLAPWAFLFFILLALPLLSSASLGIYPGEIDLQGNAGQEVCTNITLVGDEGSVFYGDLRLSGKESTDPRDYVLIPGDFGLNYSMGNPAETGTNVVCFNAKNPGNYYGALMYKMNGSYYGVVSWVKLRVEGNNLGVLRLSGDLVKSVNLSGSWHISLVLLFLVVILIFIAFRKSDKNIKKKESKN